MNFPIGSLIGVIIILALIVGSINYYNERAEPLDGDEVKYAGEWHGKNGTIITIRESGTGDYETSGKSFSFALVSIEDDVLEMDLLITNEVFEINASPFESEDGTMMVVNGEEFIKK